MNLENRGNVFVVKYRVPLGLSPVDKGLELGPGFIEGAVIDPLPEGLPPAVSESGAGHVVIHDEHGEIKRLFLVLARLGNRKPHRISNGSPPPTPPGRPQYT